jgi:hypothetical protein
MQYLLPLALVDSSYGLLAVKMEMNRTLVIDYSNQALFHFEEDFHDTELQREALLVKQEFSFVLQQAAPDRDTQLLEWPEQENIHVSPRRYYFKLVMHISACANIAIKIWCFFCDSMDSGFKVLQEMAHLYETIGNDMVHNMPMTDVSAYVMRFHVPYIC